MAMVGYDLNKGVIDYMMRSSAVEMLAASRTIAGHAKDADDLYDLMYVLGITKEHLVIGGMELDQLHL